MTASLSTVSSPERQPSEHNARKRSVLQLFKAAGLLNVMRRLSRSRLRILCYHGIWLGPDSFKGDAMFMRAQEFADRLLHLKKWNYTFLGLEDAIRLLAEGGLPHHPVVLTIDDGWYGTHRYMLPALEQAQIPATIYCDTGNLEFGKPVPQVMARYLREVHCNNRQLSLTAEEYFAGAIDLSKDRETRLASAISFAEECRIDVAPYISARAFHYMTADELRNAHERGFSIQLHTHNHSLHDFSEDNVREEIEANRIALAKILNQSKDAADQFCYPSGLTSSSAISILRQLGVKSATTLENALCTNSSDPYELPRLIDGSQLTLLEFEAELAGAGDVYRRVVGRHRNQR